MWHCIDYVLMRQSQRSFCRDVSVIHRADCWTDHKLLHAKITLRHKPLVARQHLRRRFAGYKLRDRSVGVAFNDDVVKRISSVWSDDMSFEEKWSTVRDGFVAGAEAVLGEDCRRQPDRFKQSAATLQPLIVARNNLFKRCLQSQCDWDRQRYVAKRRLVANAVKKAKNDWFQQKPKEVEDKVMRGVGAWKGIRDIQRERAGLLPTKPKAIRDLNGQFCATSADSLQRWKQHFNKVLNTSTLFSNEVINSFPSYAVRDELAGVPTLQEVRDVLSLIAGGKAGGSSGILPEMVKICNDELLGYLVQLFDVVWESKVVPQDRRDALLVPVPKKGDLSLCDNWRGISLLDVVGKAFAKVIQQLLQKVVEEVVADSQCGFWCNRGCTDMIFCARQLIEKTIEHNTKTIVLFVDLKKAYDSVPRAAVWLVLAKYGMAEVMISVIKSLHDNMHAGVTLDGNLA